MEQNINIWNAIFLKPCFSSPQYINGMRHSTTVLLVYSSVKKRGCSRNCTALYKKMITTTLTDCYIQKVQICSCQDFRFPLSAPARAREGGAFSTPRSALEKSQVLGAFARVFFRRVCAESLLSAPLFARRQIFRAP